MLDKKMEKNFNEQINKELFSAYLYLGMKTKFLEMGLKGFANWFDVQIQEEKAHAIGMYNYIIARYGKVELMPIDKPELKSESVIGLFEQVLEHEQYVTSRINVLLDVAEEVKDRAAISFLDWYLKEQVEEESNVNGILSTLRLIGEDKNALLQMDKDLASRVFVAPVIE